MAVTPSVLLCPPIWCVLSYTSGTALGLLSHAGMVQAGGGILAGQGKPIPEDVFLRGSSAAVTRASHKPEHAGLCHIHRMMPYVHEVAGYAAGGRSSTHL